MQCLLLFFVILSLFLSPSPPVAASSEDMQTLEMYYDPSDLVVTSTRNPKPISQSAENITVVTAKEIEMMGAHTLVDVFANVPGIQASDMGGPGLFNEFSVQGANVNHILVMLDGVALNLFALPFVDISGFPLQNIERIEIVKGPGSSSWGSALGAVVNIVTKCPEDGKYLGGRVSFSGGERGTRDSKGEISGSVGPFGYYLSGGNLRSDGFQRNSQADQNDIYSKLQWDLPGQGEFQFSLAYDKGHAGEGDDPWQLWRFDREYLLSNLSINYPLTDRIDLDLSLRTSHRRVHEFTTTGPPDEGKVHEQSTGGSTKITWRERYNSLVAGFDYDHLNVQDFSFHLYSDKYGLFLNDTLSLGGFSITPGIRYDKMRPVGDFFSPSLGIAWNPSHRITMRAYAARGYSLPLLCPLWNPMPRQQKVTTVQAGIETTYIPWLWLKATYFRNQLSDVQVYDSSWNIVLQKQLKEGVEVEGKSVPIFNTSLSAGYTFVDTRDRDTGETIHGVPRQLVKLGVHYDDLQHSLRGALLGRYGWLNMPARSKGKYTSFIWDLSLAKEVYRKNDTALELFFNAHNLFNGAQYNTRYRQNARRWFEGGIRFDF